MNTDTPPSGANEPAFPQLRIDGCRQVCGGLTKREEFAKAAMQGLLANPIVQDGLADGLNDSLFRASCFAADALLAALTKKDQPQ